jgi:ketosteroid isomerase-like protein
VIIANCHAESMEAEQGQPPSEDDSMGNERPITVEVLKEFLDAFNQHNVDAVMGFFAEDCTMYLPRGPKPWVQRLVGKAEVREGVVNRFAGLPDAHYGNDSHWVCGNLGVSTWTLTGTPSSGVQLEVKGIDLLEFREGKVVQKDSYWKIVEC